MIIKNLHYHPKRTFLNFYFVSFNFFKFLKSSFLTLFYQMIHHNILWQFYKNHYLINHNFHHISKFSNSLLNFDLNIFISGNKFPIKIITN